MSLCLSMCEPSPCLPSSLSVQPPSVYNALACVSLLIFLSVSVFPWFSDRVSPLCIASLQTLSVWWPSPYVATSLCFSPCTDYISPYMSLTVSPLSISSPNFVILCDWSPFCVVSYSLLCGGVKVNARLFIIRDYVYLKFFLAFCSKIKDLVSDRKSVV